MIKNRSESWQRALKRIHAYEQHYLGASEISEIACVTKSAVSSWLKRKRVIEPHVRLKMGPVWTKAQVVKWIEDELRIAVIKDTMYS